MEDDLGDRSVDKDILILYLLGQGDQYSIECDAEDIEDDHDLYT